MQKTLIFPPTSDVFVVHNVGGDALCAMPPLQQGEEGLLEFTREIVHKLFWLLRYQ